MPSRFQAITIGLPDWESRLGIAKVHARRFQVEVAPALLEVIAEFTEGFNGDEIRSLFHEACIGLYCADPPVPANAYRFGILVGRLRKAHQERSSLWRAARRTPALRYGEEPPAPSSPMVPLSPVAKPVVPSVVVTDNADLSQKNPRRRGDTKQKKIAARKPPQKPG
jgi:transitional endoplasmic reticulum ATPase